VNGPPPRELRLLTYLAPGLPLELFAAVAQYLESALRTRVVVICETRVSAPDPRETDPFTDGAADVGFLCAPGLFWMSALAHPPVELVPAAFQFDDPRTRGRPVYFADLVVGRSSQARSLADLRGGIWTFNDPCSLSGYFSMREALGRIGADESFFARSVQAGSHDLALRSVLDGAADCAALDSNFLMLRRATDGTLDERIRVVESWGPYPVQPIVVRSTLSRELKDALAASLLVMHEQEEWRRRLERCGVKRLAPISLADFAAERAVFESCIQRKAV
jgi:phosphonate transport system substrate-binding protein